MTGASAAAALPLRRAALCLDCELVVDGAAPCPACGGEALMWLGPILGLMGEAGQARERTQ